MSNRTSTFGLIADSTYQIAPSRYVIPYGCDFGPLGERVSSAQVTKHYRPEELVGRLVVAVMNFPPKRIAGFSSEVLVLGVMAAADDVVLLSPDRDVPLGAPVA